MHLFKSGHFQICMTKVSPHFRLFSYLSFKQLNRQSKCIITKQAWHPRRDQFVKQITNKTVNYQLFMLAQWRNKGLLAQDRMLAVSVFCRWWESTRPESSKCDRDLCHVETTPCHQTPASCLQYFPYPTHKLCIRGKETNRLHVVCCVFSSQSRIKLIFSLGLHIRQQ